MKKIAILGFNMQVINFIQEIANRRKILLRNFVLSKENSIEPLRHKILGLKIVFHNDLATKNAQMIIFADGVFDGEYLIEQIQSEKIIIINMSNCSKVKDFINRSNNPNTFHVVTNENVISCKSILFVNTTCRDKYILRQVTDFLEIMGEVLYITEEQLSDAFILSNCSAVFTLKFIRCIITAGMNLGLDSATSLNITMNRLQETLTHLEESNYNLELEIDRLITLNSGLITGVQELEEHGFSFSIFKGINAVNKQTKNQLALES